MNTLKVLIFFKDKDTIFSNLMGNKRYYFLASVSLAFILALAFWGEHSNSVSLLFNVILTIASLVAGFFTNQYFAEKSESQNLGKYASAGNRLSLDIYDSLKQIREQIDATRNKVSERNINKENIDLILSAISEQLELLQKFSLSANNQWRDVLPKDNLLEINRRDEVFSLSADKDIHLKEERLTLKDLDVK